MPILQVSYQVDSFIDKNKDLLYRDLSQLMFSCERKLLRKFFPEGLTLLQAITVVIKLLQAIQRRSQ